jgi:hypothetical protein
VGRRHYRRTDDGLSRLAVPAITAGLRSREQYVRVVRHSEGDS